MPSDVSEARPYWWPILTDEAYCARLREDYPEDAHHDDETLREEYAKGAKYANHGVWDHTGDAYGDFEPLADAFLAMHARYKAVAEAARELRAEFKEGLPMKQRRTELFAALAALDAEVGDDA